MYVAVCCTDVCCSESTAIMPWVNYRDQDHDLGNMQQ